MAVGAGFTTDVPTMEVASNHVFEVNEQIQGELSNLLSRLEALCGNWESPAARSFHALKDRWLTNARTLNDVLQAIGQGLVANTASYVDTDDTNDTGFVSMTGALS